MLWVGAVPNSVVRGGGGPGEDVTWAACHATLVYQSPAAEAVRPHRAFGYLSTSDRSARHGGSSQGTATDAPSIDE